MHAAWTCPPPPPPPPFLKSYKELVTKSLLSPPNIESLVSPRQVSMLLRDTKNVLLNGMLTSIYFIPLVSALFNSGHEQTAVDHARSRMHGCCHLDRSFTKFAPPTRFEFCCDRYPLRTGRTSSRF